MLAPLVPMNLCLARTMHSNSIYKDTEIIGIMWLLLHLVDKSIVLSVVWAAASLHKIPLKWTADFAILYIASDTNGTVHNASYNVDKKYKY